MPWRLVTAVCLVACVATPAESQTAQVTPFGGYRFGGDLFEEATGTALDLDGAPTIGAVVDVFTDDGLAFTFLYSHQEARVDLPAATGGPQRVRIPVDHWHVGGTQDMARGRARPFFGGTLGLTRFGADRDSEIRFSLAAGGGVKLLPAQNIGVRLDGRVYAVFMDGGATTGVCGPGLCVIGLDVSVIWQLELTAGVIFSF
jgi:hypothetical protein